jgi:hypothetical protein
VRSRVRLVTLLCLAALFGVQLAVNATSASAMDRRIVKFGVLHYGARATASVNSTAAFQRAVTAASRSPYFGVVWVPRGTYAIAGVYLAPDTHIWVQPGTRIVIASGATNNTPAFIFARKGVYSSRAAATGWITGESVIGYGGRFTIDLSNAPTVRNHAFTVMNVRNFHIDNVNVIMNNANHMGGAPSSYVAAMTFGSTPASTRYHYYHPLYGLIENVTVTHAPYGFGAAQITSGSRLTFKNVVSYGGITLRFETDAPNPSRVNIVHARGITCVSGHAAVSFAPKDQTNYQVHVSAVRASTCESGVRIAGGTGHFYYSSVMGATIRGGSSAQVNNPNVSNPAIGAWLIGHSKYCVSKGGNIHYRIYLSSFHCGL